MKKAISLFLVLALLLSTGMSALAVESAPITETAGETVTLFVPSVSLSKSDSEQTGILVFCIDKNIQVGSFTVVFSESSDYLTLGTSSSAAFPTALAGSVNIVADSTLGEYLTYNSETDGYELFQVPFTLAANAPAGAYEVTFTIDDLSDADNGDGYTMAANPITATITVTDSTPAPAPEFSVYYVIPDTLTDADSDTWGEVDPNATFTADVYIKADSAQTVEAFEIYPLAHDNLTWTAVSGVGYTAVKEDSYFAFYNTDVGSPTNIAITTAGTKVATLTFTVTDGAVYDEHMAIWFGDATNLAIQNTPESAKFSATGLDTTGTGDDSVGVETRKTVSVTFLPNGGSGIMTAQDVPYNKATALTQNAFTREDYAFLGWAESASATAAAYADKAEVTLTDELTLYAVWQQVNAEYTVEHWQQNADDNNYTQVTADTETKKGTIGQSTAATANTYEGFTAQTITQETIAASGTVVKVYYDRNTYTVTYHYLTEPPVPANAPAVPTQPNQRFGALVPVQSKPTMTGYTLDDWTIENVTISNGQFTMPNAAVTLEAAWRANQYQVTLNPTDGTLPDGTTNPITVTYDSTWPTLPDPNPAPGYAFDGWYNGNEKVTAGDTVQITGNVTLTAQYTPITYTITFVYGNGDADGTQTYTIESTDALTNPSRTNYRFTGWTVTAENGTSWAAKDGGKVGTGYTLNGDYGDVTLTAIWELDARIAVLPYAYACGDDALLLVGGTPEGDGLTYLYNGQPLYKITGDSLSAYQSQLGSDYTGDVYAYIVATNGASDPAMVGELSIGSGTAEELSKNGLVNGDTVVNSADANAVFQMLVNRNVYTNAQLSVKGRLIADMVSNDAASGFGSIADVNAIIELIKANNANG